MGKTGRKGDLTPEIHEEIIKALEAGANQKTAFERVGVGQSTYYQWIQKGNEYSKITGRELTKNELRFVEFAEDVTRARASAKYRNLSVIQACAVGGQKETVKEYHDRNGKIVRISTVYSLPDWRAAAFFLERNFPAEWGKTEYQEIGDNRKPVDEYDDLTLSELRSLSKRAQDDDEKIESNKDSESNIPKVQKH